MDRRVRAAAAGQAGGPGGLLEPSVGRAAAPLPARGPRARRWLHEAGVRPRRPSTGTALVMSGPKRPVIVGTAGHIDHGKTSLVKRLTGIDTDRLPEEQARGISIDLGFAHFDVDEFPFGLVDVPGHERFVRNMVAGATGVDLALLVVAADDSVMPQTREHLEIMDL